MFSRGGGNGTGDDNIDFKIDFDRLMAVVRRQWRVVAAATAFFVVLAVIYVATAVPRYTALTTVLIDRSQSEIVNQLAAIGSAIDDEPTVLSQLELLKSETIAASVVEKRKLFEDKLFMNQTASPLGRMIDGIKFVANPLNWFSSEDVKTADEVEAERLAAIKLITGNTEVRRVGKTYVLEIRYTSTDPDLSARVANGIAEAYLLDKLNSKYDATRRASDWLLERIDELKQKALESDLAVQRFRTENGLVAAGDTLISDQQLSELNSQLIVARAETARTRARYDRIQEIISSGKTDAIVNDVLDSSISNELRRKYLDASKLEADISRRLGPNHVQAVRLRSEMKEFERLMFEELGRIAESYQSDMNVAEAREKALQESVDAAQGVTALAGETQVQLRELQRTADTYKNLYQTFLQRYQEAIQQQSFPVTEARVISSAVAPKGPSEPNKKLVLAFSIFLGGLVGAGIGAFREFRDRFFRTGDQVRRELGVEFLGTAPLAQSMEARTADNLQDHPRHIRHVNSVTSYVLEHPLSMFAETLRSAKIAVDLSGPSQSETAKVIGVVSSLPGEGKSTVAINFAELLAMQGSRVLLIDADLRNPGSTRAIGRHAEAGLLEALIEKRPIKDMLMFDLKTKMGFLPSVVTRRVPHSSELLSSPAMKTVLETAKSTFDYVVIDLPPLAPVVDARAIASRIDSFLYVIEWGRTSRKMVKTCLENDSEIFRRCAGVILNKVDEKKMDLYRDYGSSEYYYSRYSSYYRDAS
ncbi:polysaccharide biosynthesis tyrosine autokinase [Ciceribacter sp. L1K22]|uniref:polysaccharide biosynthesis tyrosine autokinase n=1 Tax=Ciceribacter sp. L1K22 TaxID=2820275 RepID=UPI001ABED0A6|nr:polysaccharide biosynthesis tyrosine autokinase [Ciceribacter sp. L1K22]MBO3762228.1 polysaccharide biosynthesis tyrosine autokinase [Ciceribacter sp. L1K22]